MSAGAMPAEHHIPTELAAGDDHVLRAARPGDRGALRHEHGADASAHDSPIELRARHLPDRAGKLFGVREIHGADVADGLRWNIFGTNFCLECEAREDAELCSRIEAVDVSRWIGFGIAGALRVREHFAVVGAALH